MSTFLNKEIVTLYDQGLSVSEISSEMQLAEEAVRTVLSDSSIRYNKELAASTKPAENKNGVDQDGLREDDRREMLNVIRQIAIAGENDHVRLRAASYIVDEQAGRHDVQKRLNELAAKGAGTLNINVLMLNKGLARLRAGAVKPATVTIEAQQLLPQTT